MWYESKLQAPKCWSGPVIAPTSIKADNAISRKKPFPEDETLPFQVRLRRQRIHRLISQCGHSRMYAGSLSSHLSHRYPPAGGVVNFLNQPSCAHWWFCRTLARMACSRRALSSGSSCSPPLRFTTSRTLSVNIRSRHCGQRHVFHPLPHS